MSDKPPEGIDELADAFHEYRYLKSVQEAKMGEVRRHVEALKSAEEEVAKAAQKVTKALDRINRLLGR